MPRLIKPIKITDQKLLITFLGQCLTEKGQFRILDSELGSPERGMIDLLGVDNEKGVNLITVCTDTIEKGLVRCFKGYRWFKENLPIIKRLFSHNDIDYALPVKLVLFIDEVLPSTGRIAGEISKITLTLYRYSCFGPKDDPLIYIEPLYPKKPVQGDQISPEGPVSGSSPEGYIPESPECLIPESLPEGRVSELPKGVIPEESPQAPVSESPPCFTPEESVKEPIAGLPEGPPGPEKRPSASALDIEGLKRRLKIELADLSKEEIEEFLNLDLP